MEYEYTGKTFSNDRSADRSSQNHELEEVYHLEIDYAIFDSDLANGSLSVDLGLDHTNFKLSRKGESILLFHYDELTVLDSVIYSEQYKNSAYGRILESGDWCVIPPTPGESNIVPDVSDLVINEVMGNNLTTFRDEYNEYNDWIELYNSGNEALDVGGLYLSDSMANPTLFRISSEYPDSTTIPPGGHLLLWSDNSTEQGILHLGFKISKTGETLGVFDYKEELIDSTLVILVAMILLAAYVALWDLVHQSVVTYLTTIGRN